MSTKTLTPPRRTIALLVILLIASFLRFWGIDYGLPYSYWVDEYHEVMRALELGAGGFNADRIGKGGLYLLLFIEYGMYFVWLHVTGTVDSVAEFARHFVTDPSMFYLLGRMTSAIFGVLTVLFVFLIGRDAYSRTAGLLAALFLAVYPLHVDLSHRIIVDPMMTGLAAGALYFVLRVAHTGSRSAYVFSAVFAALAATTKISAVVLIVPMLVAHAYSERACGRGPAWWLVGANPWIGAAVYTGILLATNPGLLLNADALLDLFARQVDSPRIEATQSVGEPIARNERPNLYLYYISTFVDSSGPALALTSACGLAYALWKRSVADVVLVAFAGVYFIAIASTSSQTLYYPRYSLPLILVMLVFAGRLAADLVDILPRLRFVTLVLLSIILIAGLLPEALRGSWLLTQQDSRTLAKSWIEDRIPEGAKVLIEGSKISPLRSTVQLRDSPEALERRIEYWRTVEPRQAKFLEYRRRVEPGVGYDLHLMQRDDVLTLDDYRGQGIQYFVIRPAPLVGNRKSRPEAARLLHELRTNPNVKLLKTFESRPDARLGPAIEIYQAKDLQHVVMR